MVTDRWHKSHPRETDTPCSCRGRGRLYPTADHGCEKRWQVRYRDPSGRQRKRNFAKKEDVDPNTCAVAFDAKIREQVNTGVYVNPEDGQVKFAAFAEDWRAGQPHRESTRSLVERALRLYINPIIGDMPLASVRSTHIQKVVNEAGKNLEPDSVWILYGYVASIYRSALAGQVIGRSPCVGIKLPSKGVKEIVPLETDAILALADALPRRFRATVLLAAGTGLRPGEVLGLEPDCVDWLRKTLRVRQQMLTSTEPGHVPYLGEPKTAQSVRTVPLTDGVVAMLAAHLAEFPATTVKIDDLTNPRKPRRREANLVFALDNGSAIRRQTWASIFRPAAEAIGLPPRTGLHLCRHTFASAQIRFGASPKSVQKLMGHASPTITLNTYLHLWPDADDRARDAVDDFFADVPSMCPDAREG